VQAAAFDAWHVEADPKVAAQEIQFTNSDARLVGTVYLPDKGGEPLPAVVALHGASDATRDAGIFQHLRQGLPAMRVALLIYDRRGSGASSGTLKGVDYGTLADDAIAGQNALAKLQRIDPKKIGFWGFSQGGWLAVLAAERSKNAAFAISVSAPLVTPERQMQFATANLLSVRGYSSEDVKQMLET
jgi:dipeptidyl aminopeptidase/acylaminoacyl peptidase